MDINFAHAMAYIGAGIAMLTGIGVGLGEGNTASKAVESVSKNPEAQSNIISTLIVGDAMADISVIFAFVIALLLIFTKG